MITTNKSLFDQGWDARVEDANAKPLPFSGAGSRARNDEFERGFNRCDSAFNAEISASIRAGRNPRQIRPSAELKIERSAA